jgi:hypothetical protein
VRNINSKTINTVIVCMFLCITLIVPAVASADFEYRQEFAAGDGPHFTELVDLDGDSDLDIITADYYGDSVSILMNDGEGTFTKDSDYKTDEGPRSLFCADIDGDLDIDIITGNYQGDTVSVLKNKGDGTFATKSDYDTGTGPYSIFLADVKEDSNGDLDLVTADEQSDQVSVLTNNGNGVFSNRKTYKVGSKPKGVFLADLNKDGFTDIATANWIDDTASVLFNKGDGTFKKDKKYDTGSSPRGIYLADVNGDNIPDITTANQHSNSISILVNNGDETFQGKRDYLVGDNPLSIYLGDIDSDNDMDALVTNLNADSISVLKNDGLGNFGERVDYPSDDGPYSVSLGDVNGDGGVDIVVANNYGDSVSVHYSNIPPIIIIMEPNGENDAANSFYTITWNDFDPYEDAEITLYWDHDNTGFDGTQIASGLSEDSDDIGGRYQWNISELPEDDYWIYAKINDGIFSPRYDYSLGPISIDHSITTNTPPTFQIIEPDGESDTADREFTFMWIDSDPDDDAVISLYYDQDKLDFNGNLIVSGLSENADGGHGFYTWNTTRISEGEYYIYGICNDGVNEPVKTYNPYPLKVVHYSSENPPPSNGNDSDINNPPMIQIVEPNGELDHTDSEYMIQWIDSDPDDDASISLYYDTDSSGYDGVLITSEISEDFMGNSGAYIWDTSEIPIGEYFIYAIIKDNLNDHKDYSLGKLTVDHPQDTNTVPKILVIYPKGIVENNFTIQWIDSDSDDDALISLFSDTDQNGYDGVLIASGLSEDDDLNQFSWDTSNISDGEYYIYAEISDGVNDPVYDYSDGRIKVNNSLVSIEEGGSQNEKASAFIFSFLILLVLLILIFLLIAPKKQKKQKAEDDIYREEDFMESEKELGSYNELDDNKELDEELESSGNEVEDIMEQGNEHESSSDEVEDFKEPDEEPETDKHEEAGKDEDLLPSDSADEED